MFASLEKGVNFALAFGTSAIERGCFLQSEENKKSTLKYLR